MSTGGTMARDAAAIDAAAHNVAVLEILCNTVLANTLRRAPLCGRRFDCRCIAEANRHGRLAILGIGNSEVQSAAYMRWSARVAWRVELSPRGNYDLGNLLSGDDGRRELGGKSVTTRASAGIHGRARLTPRETRTMRSIDAHHTQPASHGISRREVLTLASAALLTACAGPDSRDSKQAAFPKGAVIRTLLKDMSPASLASGAVLFHEHLSMKYPPNVKEHYTDDVELMIEEVRAAGKDGISCIVDGGHADMARNLDALKRIASATDVAIVASGGYYMQRTYPPGIAGKSAEQIADSSPARHASNGSVRSARSVSKAVF